VEINKLGKDKWQFKKQVAKVIDELNVEEKGKHNVLRVSSIGSVKIVDALRCKFEKNVSFEKTSKRGFITYGIGSAVHEWLQYLVSSASKSLYADWMCPECGGIVKGVDVVGCSDPECGFDGKLKHKESYLFYGDDVAGIGGHLDIAKFVPDLGIFIVDIKTANDNSFRRIKDFGPYPEYIVQVVMYMFLMKSSIERGEITCFGNVKDVFGRVYFLNKNDSSELEFGIKYCEEIVNRCLLMYKFYRESIVAGKIADGYDLADLNRTVVEVIGDKFVDLWYPV
jgi:hypothetical protein